MRKTTKHRRVATQRGSFLVETGLTLTLFLTVILALIDVGRAVWVHNAISHLSREGSRYAMVHGATNATPATAAKVKSIIAARAFSIDTAELNVDTTWESGNQPGNPVQVDVTYTFKPYLPLLAMSNISMRSRSVMTISR